MSTNINDILVNRTNALTEQIEHNPDIVVERLTLAMNAIINGMAADLERRKLPGLLSALTQSALTQYGGANDELVASAGTTTVTKKEVGGVTDAIEDAIVEALSKGELEKAERLQAMSARQRAIVAAEKMSNEARRMVSAAAAAEEGKERRETVEFIRNNVVQGARFAGGVSIAYVMAKVIKIVPDLGTAIVAAAGSGAVGGLVNVYNTVFASSMTNWATGIQPINGTEIYNGLVRDIKSSGIGQVFTEGTDNLFILIMIMCFAMVVCCYTMINLLGDVEELRIFPGVGVRLSRGRRRGELPTPNSERNAALIFRAAEQAAAQALGSSPGAQALGSSAAATQALSPSPEAQAIEGSTGPTIEEVPGGGRKNKRKRRKSRKQQKSKKSKKSHKSRKQQKSRKKQRKSRKNLKFKKTRK